ncbi:MAG TPA: SH3 domain-containing protein, partial [Thermomicrobiales bacterium]|nr:SH3 domain-containing protein [Thermomicrobiales bacterium]
ARRARTRKHADAGLASPAASPVAQAKVQSTVLMRTSFDAFVPAPMTIRMLRITLAPGATVPMHTHPGPEFDRVESGTLTVLADGDATITRASGDTEAASAEGTALETGDWVVYQADAGMSFENQSEEDVVLLSAVLLPVGSDYPESITYTGGSPTSADFEGVSFSVLGDGLVQDFPAGAASVTIDSLVVPPGTDLPATDSVAMYSQVDGNFSFTVDSGAVQVSRTKLEALQPNAIPGEEFTLEPGDAAFFPAGVTATSRASEKAPLELLRLTLDPEGDVAGNPAALTFTAGSATSGDATGGAETTPAAEAATGALVTVNADNVNLRAEPNTSADVVDQLAAGVELEVIGGPEEGEGYTWWHVRVTSQGGAEGWIASDFFDGNPQAGAEAATTPTPAATPAAGATFAEGATVVTTEDNVRIRAEASVNADVVNAFPAGTEFVITGAPRQADDYTWYPVALVGDESVTGWLASDFLAPAEGGQ